jgi:hypothetical protein
VADVPNGLSLTPPREIKKNKLTGAYAAGASVFYFPPPLIFPRKRTKKTLSFGAPPGTVSHCHDKSWMDYDVFSEWKHNFISVVKLMPQEKLILTLDGHSSHRVWLLLKFLANMGLSCFHCIPTARSESRYYVFQATEYIHGISDCSEAERETWAATLHRTYCVAGGHGVPKVCDAGKGYESVHE